MSGKCVPPVPGAPDHEAHCDCWFDAGEDERVPCCWCGYSGTDIRVWCMSNRPETWCQYTITMDPP